MQIWAIYGHYKGYSGSWFAYLYILKIEDINHERQSYILHSSHNENVSISISVQSMKEVSTEIWREVSSVIATTKEVEESGI